MAFWYSIHGDAPEYAGTTREEAERVRAHLIAQSRVTFTDIGREIETISLEDVWIGETVTQEEAEEKIDQYWWSNPHLFYWADVR